MHEPHDRLLAAALHGDAAAAKEALEAGASVDTRDTRDRTVLMIACERGDRAFAELLLSAGASPNRRTTDSEETVMHQLARQHNAEAASVLSLVLKHSPRIDRLDRFGWTPLMVASQVGALENVRALLASGADPSLTAPDGRSAAMLASESGHLDVAGLL